MNEEKEILNKFIQSMDYNLIHFMDDSTKRWIDSKVINIVKERLVNIDENEKRNEYSISYKKYRKYSSGCLLSIKYVNHKHIEEYVRNKLNCYYDDSFIYVDLVKNMLYVNTWWVSPHNGDPYDEQYKAIPFENGVDFTI